MIKLLKNNFDYIFFFILCGYLVFSYKLPSDFNTLNIFLSSILLSGFCIISLLFIFIPRSKKNLEFNLETRLRRCIKWCYLLYIVFILCFLGQGVLQELSWINLLVITFLFKSNFINLVTGNLNLKEDDKIAFLVNFGCQLLIMFNNQGAIYNFDYNLSLFIIIILLSLFMFSFNFMFFIKNGAEYKKTKLKVYKYNLQVSFFNFFFMFLVCFIKIYALSYRSTGSVSYIIALNIILGFLLCLESLIIISIFIIKPTSNIIQVYWLYVIFFIISCFILRPLLHDFIFNSLNQAETELWFYSLIIVPIKYIIQKDA
jgi:hypothetical protein